MLTLIALGALAMLFAGIPMWMIFLALAIAGMAWKGVAERIYPAQERAARVSGFEVVVDALVVPAVRHVGILAVAPDQLAARHAQPVELGAGEVAQVHAESL